MTFEIVSPNTVQAGPVSGSAGPVTARALVTADLPSGALVNGGALGTPSSGNGTNITNVNAATLGGATFAAPGAIGGGTAAAGSFTTLSASENISTSLNKTGLLEISTSNPNSGTNSGAAFNSYYGATKMSGIGHYWDGGAFQNLLEYCQTLNIKKTDGTAVAVLDTHGNLGLGVVPSAWTMRAIELVGGALASNGADDIRILANSYFNGANYIYKAPGLASRYQQDATGHAWYTSPFGTAGTSITFTQAMKLDANGNLSNLGVIKTGVFTVGTLPSASAVGVGSIAFVTDSNTTVILGLGLTVIGGGSNKVPVYSGGTNWIVG
jgi:hypothetical protein